MIRITVELVPHGTGEPVVLGTGVIANDGTGTVRKGNYKAVLWHKGRPWRKTLITGFPRMRLNVWHLLHLVLAEATRDG